MAGRKLKSASTGSRRKKTRVLIIDDHPLVRRGLSELIGHETDMEICGEARDAPTAMDLLESARPDLAIVDISLEKGHGIDLIQQMRTKAPSLSILVLSMHDESLYGERALRAGALGYLSKQEPSEKIIEAIRHVVGGRVYLSSRTTQTLLRRPVPVAGDAGKPSLHTLSNREMTVLSLIGKGLGSREIAQQLHLSPKTVDTHRENIKRKLNLKNGSELVRYAIARSLGSD